MRLEDVSKVNNNKDANLLAKRALILVSIATKSMCLVVVVRYNNLYHSHLFDCTLGLSFLGPIKNKNGRSQFNSCKTESK